MEGAQLVAKTKETKQLYFARAKKLIQVGVLDVPGLKAEYKQSELTYVSGKIWIDICIVDHKIVHVDEQFKFSSPGQYQPITSTAWRIQKYSLWRTWIPTQQKGHRSFWRRVFRKEENPDLSLWWQPSYDCHIALCSWRGIRWFWATL